MLGYPAWVILIHQNQTKIEAIFLIFIDEK